MEIRKAHLISTLIAISSGFLFCASVQGRVQPPKLIDLIKYSDLIAEGKVTTISVVRGVRIARLDVTRVHKGNPTIKRLYLWASRTWACDISGAELGESGLYFLSLARENQLWVDNADFGDESGNVLQGGRLYSISGSGYGRFINSGAKLKASDFVRFPRAVAVKHVRTGDYTSVALVDPGDIVWLIHTKRPRRGV
jgi:hypothetical protein